MRYILSTPQARKNAAQAVLDAAEGYVVEIKEPKRTLAENALLHAVLTELAKQATWHGQKLPMEVWKRLCVAAWLRERGEQPMMVPALDGHGVDIVYHRTSKLNKRECAELIDYVYALGAGLGVKFTEGR